MLLNCGAVEYFCEPPGQQIVKDREPWQAVVHGVIKNQT